MVRGGRVSVALLVASSSAMADLAVIVRPPAECPPDRSDAQIFLRVVAEQLGSWEDRSQLLAASSRCTVSTSMVLLVGDQTAVAVGSLSHEQPAEAFGACARGAVEGQAFVLPPAPASGSLVLIGLITLGAWQAGGSARHWHLAALPEWYHSHAAQVCHTVPFELGRPVLLPCWFAVPSQGPPAGRYQPLLTRDIPRLESQAILLLAAPRGPPQQPVL